jgi:hypothetical protein
MNPLEMAERESNRLRTIPGWDAIPAIMQQILINEVHAAFLGGMAAGMAKSKAIYEETR